jgi:ABC-type ATPase with predicted acetyltransferase domain
MAYLVKDDYTISTSIDHLDQILVQAAKNSGLTADKVRTNSEDTAEAEINAYLSKYYDTATEFTIDGSVAPETRNKLIIRCMVNLSLYNIFHTISPRDIPEMRQKLYDDCIEMLKGYRDGMLDFGLDVIDADMDGEPDVERTMLESAKKFISKPFTDPSLL